MFARYTSTFRLPSVGSYITNATAVPVTQTMDFIEAGYKYSQDRLSLYATVFNTNFDSYGFSELVFNPTTNGYDSRTVYTDTKTFGVELEGTVYPGEFVDIAFSATWQDPKFGHLTASSVVNGTLVVSDYSDNQLIRVPRISYRIAPAVNLLDNAFRLELGFQHFGERYSDAANSVTLPDYAVVSANARYSIGDHVTLYLRGENLLNEVGLTEGNPRAGQFQSGEANLPFLPAGTRGLSIRFDYTGRDQRTVIDIGLLGPDGFTGEDGFRGWSGGSKRAFTVAANDASPSYLPGPLTPGRWNLLLGVPNIRAGQAADFTAEISFEHGETEAARTAYGPVVKATPGWYRGDLHSHTGHSDGSCSNRSGKQRVGCPLFLMLEAAAQQRLDFLAVTEHNTISHVRDLSALQPYFDELLLIPGMEVTTFQGHANAFGVTDPVDFRVGSDGVPDWNAVLTALNQRGVVVSINHPKVPAGESCMGCAWSPQRAADLSQLQAVEIVNGHDVETPKAGIPFWHEQLQRGFRLTGIGGSDTHDATSALRAPPIGRVGAPTTVVQADALSVPAILSGIRAGNVFVDTEGTADRLLNFTVRIGERNVTMGSDTTLARGEEALFTIQVRNIPAGHIEVIRDGVKLAAVDKAQVTSADHSLSFIERGDGARHWLRVDVRGADNRLLLIGNPIYINRQVP